MTTASPVPSSIPEAQAQISAFGRVIGAIANPKPTFEDIARKPSWILPVIIVIVLNLATIFVFSQRVGWEQVIRQQLEQSPRSQQMTAEQREQAVQRGAPIAKIIGYVGPIFVIVAFLAEAGIFLGAMNLIGGARVSFSKSLGIVAHSAMPGCIAFLLGIAILFLKNPETVDIQNLVGSNLGVLLGSDSPKWLSSLAQSIDLFSFWSMALLATGYSAADPKKLTWGKALGVVIGVWAIYVILKVVLSAAFS